MEVGEVPKGIRWSAEAEGPPKVRIGGVSGQGRGPTIKKEPFYCEVPTRGPTRRWSPSSPPGSLDGSPHSLGYPPAHRVSFASAGIQTRHQELKVLREAPLLPTELLDQLVAGMLP